LEIIGRINKKQQANWHTPPTAKASGLPCLYLIRCDS
jgi:hypothetical protein